MGNYFPFFSNVPKELIELVISYASYSQQEEKSRYWLPQLICVLEQFGCDPNKSHMFTDENGSVTRKALNLNEMPPSLSDVRRITIRFDGVRSGPTGKEYQIVNSWLLHKILGPAFVVAFQFLNQTSLVNYILREQLSQSEEHSIDDYDDADLIGVHQYSTR